MTNDTGKDRADVQKPNFRVEFIAGLSTYLTLSYIFLLNPVLLAKTGMDISVAFCATVISATLATLAMGFLAKVPFAVAPVPSVTTFLVSYICMKLGFTWQEAMVGVILSGGLSVLLTTLSVRSNLIKSMPPALGIGVLFAVCGFLVANGLTQAQLINYSENFVNLTKFNNAAIVSPNAAVFCTGLLVTLLFHQKWIKFAGAPVLGIFAASIVASYFGIHATTKAELSAKTLSTAWNQFLEFCHQDFHLLLDKRFFMAIMVFLIIDFFGGIGKFIGLFAAMGNRVDVIDPVKIKRSLYVDGWGTFFGGFLGSSSLAVFVSSAVGIVTGGRTGRTAIVTACFMFASLFFIPLVGAIPVQATSGILVFVGFLLIPYEQLKKKSGVLTRPDIFISLCAALIPFATYRIDWAMAFVFGCYSVLIIKKGEARSHRILLVVSALLLLAIISQLWN